MSALLGVPVPAGFVARADERLAHWLDAAGFDAAMRAALGAEPVVATSRNHGMRPIDAIHVALAGRPWRPAPVST